MKPWLICFLHCLLAYFCVANGILIRVRRANGLIAKLNCDVNDSVSSLALKLTNSMNITADDSITFNRHNEVCKISNLLTNETLISLCNLKQGDLLTVISTNVSDSKYNNCRRTITRFPLRTNSINRLPFSKAKLKIRQQRASSLRQLRIHEGTRSLFERSINSTNSLLLILGKSTTFITAKNSRSNVHTINSIKESNKRFDDVVAVIEITSINTTIDASSVLKRRVENAVKLAQSLNLTIQGVALNLETTIGWSSQHIHTVLQIYSICSQSNISNVTSIKSDFAIVRVKNSSTKVSTKKTASKSISMSSEVTLEAYQLSDQALQLYSDGFLTTHSLVNSSMANSSVIQLNGSILIQSSEVSTIDSMLLVVPVPISMVNSTSSNKAKENIPVFYHLFPTFDQLCSSETQQSAERYLFRLLKNILARDSSNKNNKDYIDAINRLRDPHLLLFMQSILGETICNELCFYLTINNYDESLPVTVLRALQRLQVSLEHRLTSSNVENEDE